MSDHEPIRRPDLVADLETPIFDLLVEHHPDLARSAKLAADELWMARPRLEIGFHFVTEEGHDVGRLLRKAFDAWVDTPSPKLRGLLFSAHYFGRSIIQLSVTLYRARDRIAHNGYVRGMQVFSIVSEHWSVAAHLESDHTTMVDAASNPRMGSGSEKPWTDFDGDDVRHVQGMYREAFDSIFASEAARDRRPPPVPPEAQR